MGTTWLGPDGQVEMASDETPEAVARAEAKLLRLIEALARADAERDYADQVEALARTRAGSKPQPSS
jgi:hypothetical protein